MTNVQTVLDNIARHPPIDDDAVINACIALYDTLTDAGGVLPTGNFESALALVHDERSAIKMKIPGNQQSELAAGRVRDAVISMAKFAVTSNSVARLAQVISTILNCPDSLEPGEDFEDSDEKNSDKRNNGNEGVVAAVAFVFATAEIRDAFVAMAAYATTSAAVMHISRAIHATVTSARGVSESSAALAVFACTPFCNALMAMSKNAESSAAVEWLAICIDGVVTDCGATSVFGEHGVRDTVAAMSKSAQTSTSVAWLARLACSVLAIAYKSRAQTTKSDKSDKDEFDDSRAFGFATPEMRDVIIAMSKHAETAAAVGWICGLITRIVAHDNAKDELIVQRFANSAMRDALIQMSQHADSEFSMVWVSRAINSLTCETTDDAGTYDRGHEALMLLFGTEAMHDALLQLMRRARTSKAVESVAAALSDITCPKGPELKKVFGTPSIRDALIGMLSFATSEGAKYEVLNAICFITRNSDDNKRTFASSSSLRDAICTPALRSTGTIFRIATIFRNLTMKPKDAAYFVSPQVRDALLSLLNMCEDTDTCARTAWTISLIARYIKDSAETSFFNVDMRDALVRISIELKSLVPGLRGGWSNAVAFLLRAFCDISIRMSKCSKPAASRLLAEVCVHNALVSCSRFVTGSAVCSDDTDVVCFAKSIVYIARSRNDIKLRFATDEMRKALVVVSSKATTADDAKWILIAISTLLDCGGDRVAETFRAIDVALIRVARFIGPHLVMDFAKCVVNLTKTSNNALKESLGSPGIRDALISMSSMQITREAASWILNAFHNITSCRSARVLATVGTSLVRDALIRVSSSESIALFHTVNHIVSTRNVLIMLTFSETSMQIALTAIRNNESDDVTRKEIDALLLPMSRFFDDHKARLQHLTNSGEAAHSNGAAREVQNLSAGMIGHTRSSVGILTRAQ